MRIGVPKEKANENRVGLVPACVRVVALADDAHLRNGLNVCRGQVTFEAVARDLALDYTPAETLLAEGRLSGGWTDAG